MAINPVQTAPTAMLPHERVSARRNGTSAFDNLLDTLNSGKELSGKMGGQAGAELLRMEMMQSCLSLADNAESTHPFRSQALEAILEGLGANSRVSRTTTISGPTATVEPPSGDPFPGNDAGEIDRTAFRFLGTPYLFGGEGPAGIDCSSFVQQVFKEHQVDLPRTAREQSMVGKEVAPAELRRGDLVFFSTYASYPSHVGIYLGDGKMIHASSQRGEVVVSNMDTDYFRSRFLGARRVA